MKDNQLIDDDYALWNEPAFNISDKEIAEELESFSHRIRSRKRERSAIYSVVAVILVGISLMSGIKAGLSWSSDRAENIAWTEVCVRKGSKQELILPDGSKATLAPGSRLMYPERFSGKERSVFMSGEVLFDIVSDKECPFKVSVNGTEISVTGTIFNVKAYHLDDIQTITLMQGNIEVDCAQSSSSVHMAQGSALSVNTRTGDMQMYDVPESRYPAWFKGEYNAYNETLAQIALDLERIYDVDIVFRNKSLENQVFYLSIVDASSIDDVLSALSRSGKVRIRKEGELIYFN